MISLNFPDQKITIIAEHVESLAEKNETLLVYMVSGKVIHLPGLTLDKWQDLIQKVRVSMMLQQK